MSATTKESLYPLLSDDEDLGNDSDTVAGSERSLRKRSPSPGQHTPSRNPRSKVPRAERFLQWLRWGSVISLQLLIVGLLLLRTNAPIFKEVETGGDINGLYPALSHHYKVLKPEVDTYMPNMTSNNDRLAIRHNWDLLMPLGSGSVAIPEYKQHPLLGDPITDDPIRSGPLFEASWTHALHCLYYSVDSYHQLIVNGRTGAENPHHAGHCFEYLRTSILCNLDMTLEGQESTARVKEGGGQAHVCRNREEVVSWIEARRVDDLQDIVGP